MSELAFLKRGFRPISLADDCAFAENSAGVQHCKRIFNCAKQIKSKVEHICVYMLCVPLVVCVCC